MNASILDKYGDKTRFHIKGSDCCTLVEQSYSGVFVNCKYKGLCQYHCECGYCSPAQFGVNLGSIYDQKDAS